MKYIHDVDFFPTLKYLKNQNKSLCVGAGVGGYENVTIYFPPGCTSAVEVIYPLKLTGYVQT